MGIVDLLVFVGVTMCVCLSIRYRGVDRAVGLWVTCISFGCVKIQHDLDE